MFKKSWHYGSEISHIIPFDKENGIPHFILLRESVLQLVSVIDKQVKVLRQQPLFCFIKDMILLKNSSENRILLLDDKGYLYISQFDERGFQLKQKVSSFY